MRRLLRRLVNGLGIALCALSVLACLGTASLWWRSYHGRRDRLNIRLHSEPYRLDSERGRVIVLGIRHNHSAQQDALRQSIRSLHNSDLRWDTALSAHGETRTDWGLPNSIAATLQRRAAGPWDAAPLFEDLGRPRPLRRGTPGPYPHRERLVAD